MQIGLFTALFQQLSLDELLQELKHYPQISMLELGTGGWPGNRHIDLEGLLASTAAVAEVRMKLRDVGLTISALSCHGNPVHPVDEIARRDDAIFQKTLCLAERLEVPVVITFSGCPGGSAGDSTPNWITTAWPPEYADALAWQWEQRLIPYWRRAARMATDAGVKVALEAHPGFCVYNPETLLRLRSATGTALGVNLDPSHLWWQGIDLPVAIAALGEAIFHVHAKDVAMNPAQRNLNGVIDAKKYSEMAKRSWLFRSVGWGHGELEWKQIASALRLVGYDYVMSIEHEDALISVAEGLTAAVDMLGRVLLKEPVVETWWI